MKAESKAIEFDNWLDRLYQVARKETGKQIVAISHDTAKEYFESGYEPKECFIEAFSES